MLKYVYYFCTISQNANPYGCRRHLCKLDRRSGSTKHSCTALVLKAKELPGSYPPLSEALRITKERLWKPEEEERTQKSQVFNAVA